MPWLPPGISVWAYCQSWSERLKLYSSLALGFRMIRVVQYCKFWASAVVNYSVQPLTFEQPVRRRRVSHQSVRFIGEC